MRSVTNMSPFSANMTSSPVLSHLSPTSITRSSHSRIILLDYSPVDEGIFRSANPLSAQAQDETSEPDHARSLILVVPESNLRAFEEQLSRLPHTGEGAIRLHDLRDRAGEELPRTSQCTNVLRNGTLQARRQSSLQCGVARSRRTTVAAAVVSVRPTILEIQSALASQSRKATQEARTIALTDTQLRERRHQLRGQLSGQRCRCHYDHAEACELELLGQRVLMEASRLLR